MPSQNPFLLAADNSPALLPLLREHPQLAAEQDEHGYSLIHAAASYNHLDLLRTLVRDFGVPVGLRDEDDETALFVVETVAAARVLVEELGLDATLTGAEGLTAAEKMEVEGDYPEVVEYLVTKGGHRGAGGNQSAAPAATGANGVVNGASTGGSSSSTGEAAASPAGLPPAPEGLSVTVGTMAEPGAAPGDVDPEFRARIEALAARDDFDTDAAQAELRRLVEEAVLKQDLSGERNVRTRQE